MSAGSGRKFGQPYARASIKGKKVYMHRFIMNAEQGSHVDHINHMTLDNRKSNLREVHPTTNQKNRRKKNV
jgi:hypothetical protein